LFNEIKNTDSFKVHQTCTSWITVFYYEWLIFYLTF
jgi:hypothetical protein